MKNKTDKSGNFTDIHIDNMHISVNAPNNYVITNDGKILKVQKILHDVTGLFKLVGVRVKEVLPLYNKPIMSNLLNIYVSKTDDFTENITEFRATEDLRKVARLELDSKYFYLALLH